MAESLSVLVPIPVSRFDLKSDETDAHCSAATDAGFSTSWSKDGRKFAVASQGQSSSRHEVSLALTSRRWPSDRLGSSLLQATGDIPYFVESSA